jgi:hypothetical protein
VNSREIEELAGYLTPTEREEFDALVLADFDAVGWRPLPGPQTVAYNSPADVIGFGGAAGGGKTDLACGMAITKHKKTAMFRRVGTELVGIVDRLVELFGGREGYNGQEKIWRRDGLQIELASVPNLGDEAGHQGRPKDLLVLDEAANFLEAQVRFLMGWVRSVHGIRAKTLMTFNPPTSAEGRWVVSFFAPWIEKGYAGPDGRALPGELRYVAMIPGENGVSKDMWFGRDNPGQFVLIDNQPVWNFDPRDYKPEDIVTPQSRTFIPSRISDNPYLATTGYMTVLQSMPEPLRSQMLYGDFGAGMEDDAFQVIPTAWVERAMERWTDRSPKGEMTSMGVDVARGGKDNTVLAMRHDNWIDRLKRIPGTGTPDGQAVVAHVIANRRDSAPVHVDGIGVGASPVDLLRDVPVQTISVNVSETSRYGGKAGNLKFFNQRSELWWRMREALDPTYDTGLMLPPDKDLLAELCAPRWEPSGKTIKVESREDIVDRVGRSPDAATAVILSLIATPNQSKVEREARDRARREYNPLSGRAPIGGGRGYDPLANY